MRIDRVVAVSNRNSWGAGWEPGFALQADSLIGAIPMRSTNMIVNAKRLEQQASQAWLTEFKSPRDRHVPLGFW